MIGFFVGIVAGAFQFWLLSKFTKAITSGSFSTKNVLFGLVQFFLPLGVLVGIAFLRRQDLLWAGIGIICSLIFGAIAKYFINTRKLRGREDNNG